MRCICTCALGLSLLGACDDAPSDGLDACPAAASEALCSCREPGLSPIADLETTLADWTDAHCPHSIFVVEGSCGTGHLLYRSTGLSYEQRFFDSDGAFEAMQLTTDTGGCRSSTAIPCDEAVVTRVVCGDRIEVGDPIPLVGSR